MHKTLQESSITTLTRPEVTKVSHFALSKGDKYLTRTVRGQCTTCYAHDVSVSNPGKCSIYDAINTLLKYND